MAACRLVGPDCNASLVHENGLFDAIDRAFKRVNEVSGLVVGLASLTAASPALGTEGELPFRSQPALARMPARSSHQRCAMQHQGAPSVPLNGISMSVRGLSHLPSQLRLAGACAALSALVRPLRPPARDLVPGCAWADWQRTALQRRT